MKKNVCGSTPLETRKLRRDEMFNKPHEVKLVKDQCRLDIRKHSFSQRTINEWNTLSTDCVTALLRYVSTLLLNIFTLLAVTQSVDNLFHSFIVLCEKECFLMSNLH